MSIKLDALTERVRQHIQTTFGGDLQAYLDSKLDALIDEVILEHILEILRTEIKVALLETKAFTDRLISISRLD